MKNNLFKYVLMTVTTALVMISGCKSQSGAKPTPTHTPTPLIYDLPSVSCTPTPIPQVAPLSIYKDDGYHNYTLYSDSKGNLVFIYETSPLEDCIQQSYIHRAEPDGNSFVLQHFPNEISPYGWHATVHGDYIWITDYFTKPESEVRTYYYCYDFLGNLWGWYIYYGDEYLYTTSDYLYLYEYDSTYGTYKKLDAQEGKGSALIPINKDLFVSGMGQVVNTYNGLYLDAPCLFSDLSTGNVIIDLSTGDPIWINDYAEDSPILRLDEMPVEVNYGDERYEFAIHAPNGKKISFSYDNSTYVNFDILNERYVLFSRDRSIFSEEPGSDGDSLYGNAMQILEKAVIEYALYDMETASFVAELTLEDDTYICPTALNYFTNDNQSMLLGLGTMDGFTRYVQWNFGLFPGLTNDSWDFMEFTVSDYVEQVVSVPTGEWTRDKYISGKCDPDFLSLREYADSLEEKYDIKIYISGEAGGLFGNNYLGIITDNLSGTEGWLKALDQGLAEYPKGFFTKFKHNIFYNSPSTQKTLSFYFIDKFIGVSNNTLSNTGGLCFEKDGSISIAFDVNSLPNINSINHEMSHAIEKMIPLVSSECIDSDIWNSFAKEATGIEDFYSYIYNDKYYETPYLSYVLYWTEGTDNPVCFLNTYDITYPTEDRADLFAEAMRLLGEEKKTAVKLSKYPVLYKKYAYYCEVIRKAFYPDEPDIELPWEKGLK